MKKLLIFFCGLMTIALTACNDDNTDIDNIQDIAQSDSVEAYTPNDSSTRVDFTENGDNTISLEWETEESFSIIRGNENQTFSKTTEGNTFTGTRPTAGEGNYYATYPITSATDATAVPIDFTEQTGELNSNMTFMYASSETGLSYEFQHCAAILKATFTGLPGGAKVEKIVVTTDESVKVKGTLNLTNGTFSGTESNTITVNYVSPKPITSAYFYLPAMPKEAKSLSFTVITDDDKIYVCGMSAAGSKDIEAGKLYTATFALVSTLTFTSNESQAMKVNSTSVTYDALKLEYSYDGVVWNKIENANEIPFTGGKIMMRGKNNIGTSGATIQFTNDELAVDCIGDIRSLVDYTANPSNIRYNQLFKNCKALRTAPALPATTLTNDCYINMFEGCTSLQAAPELPAVSLAYACYEYMFKDCTSLETAPTLPATTLNSSCYQSMFEGCTSLETAPALPATQLHNYCYNCMFKGCTSLTTINAISALELAEECCYAMFEGCTSLQTAPTLPATTLYHKCYTRMFAGCTSLVTVPDLPATDLAGFCYDAMFEGCTSLQTAPKLPATYLSSHCYHRMFTGCSSLNSVTMLATEFGYNSIYNWLEGVAVSGTIYVKNNDVDLPEGASGIPSGWTKQVYTE